MEKNKYMKIYVEDTKNYGIIRASLIGVIKGWCETNKGKKGYEHNGFTWSGHMTYDDLVEQTGLPYETVKKNIIWLEDNNVIISGKFNKVKFDKTKWYRTNPSVLSGLFDEVQEEQQSVLSGLLDEVQEDGPIPTLQPTPQPIIQQTTLQPANPKKNDYNILEDLNLK
jgi:hypothetical protein